MTSSRVAVARHESERALFPGCRAPGGAGARRGAGGAAPRAPRSSAAGVDVGLPDPVIRLPARPPSELCLLAGVRHHARAAAGEREAARRGWRRGRRGVALLQGLVRCGRCGRRMQVAYSGRDGRVPRYACVRGYHLHATERTCQTLGGTRLDRAVSDAFLEAVTPAAVAASAGAIAELEHQHEARLEGQRLALERAQWEAGRARRQFDRCGGVRVSGSYGPRSVGTTRGPASLGAPAAVSSTARPPRTISSTSSGDPGRAKRNP